MAGLTRGMYVCGSSSKSQFTLVTLHICGIKLRGCAQEHKLRYKEAGPLLHMSDFFKSTWQKIGRKAGAIGKGDWCERPQCISQIQKETKTAGGGDKEPGWACSTDLDKVIESVTWWESLMRHRKDMRFQLENSRFKYKILEANSS